MMSNEQIPTPIAQVGVVEADPKRPYKAYAAAALAGVGAAVAYWIGDEDPFTKKDAGEAFLAGLAAMGVGGVGTFLTKNPLRSRTLG
jgi:hypothetical protein